MSSTPLRLLDFADSADISHYGVINDNDPLTKNKTVATCTFINSQRDVTPDDYTSILPLVKVAFENGSETAVFASISDVDGLQKYFVIEKKTLAATTLPPTSLSSKPNCPPFPYVAQISVGSGNYFHQWFFMIPNMADFGSALCGHALGPTKNKNKFAMPGMRYSLYDPDDLKDGDGNDDPEVDMLKKWGRTNSWYRRTTELLRHARRRYHLHADTGGCSHWHRPVQDQSESR